VHAGDEIDVHISSDVPYTLQIRCRPRDMWRLRAEAVRASLCGVRSRVSDNVEVSDRDADEVIFSTHAAARQQPVPIGSFIAIPWSAPARARPALSISLWAFLVNSHQVMHQRAQSLLSLGGAGEDADPCLSVAIETLHVNGGIVMSLIFASEGNAPVLLEHTVAVA
jgi:hypothetical protein